MSDTAQLKVHVLSTPGGTDRFRGLYIPGDEISGIVKLSLHKETKVNALTVQFRGRCDVTVGEGKNSVQWDTTMFCFRKTLLPGGARMFPGFYEYPFTFHFPATYTSHASFSDHGLFSTSRGLQPLPPTCFGDTSSGSYSINYSVIAHSSRTVFDWKHTVALPFTTCRTEAFPDPVYALSGPGYQLTLQHFKIGDNGLPRALGTREAMKNSIHHSADVSTIKYKLMANAPTVIVPGKPYHVELKLRILSNEGHTDTMPEFRVKRVALSLKAKTHIRALSTFSDRFDTVETEIRLGTANCDILLPFNTPKALSGLLTPSPAFGYASPLPPPSFMSVAVNRQYSMQLQVVLECLGEQHKFKISWSRVFVHPARMEPGVEEAIDAIRNTQSVAVATADDGETRNADEEQPPSYEEAQTQGGRLPGYAP